MAHFFELLSLLLIILLSNWHGAAAAPTAGRTAFQKGRSISPSVLGGHWVDTWTAMPQLTEFTNLPNAPFNQSNLVFPNSTVRQTLHMSIGSEQIRVRISNAFGPNDLPVTAMTVAFPGNGSTGVNGSAGASDVETQTLQAVTFNGNTSIIIPGGALVVSDPLNFPIEPQSEISVSMYLENGQASNYITSHPGSRTNTFYSFGNYVNAQNMSDPSTQVQAHWFFLSAIEAWSPQNSSAFAIVGDSITDGRGSDTDGNDRWPDLVLGRMQNDSATRHIAVVNQAAGGNRVLYDGLGPNAVSRIDRDVLAQSGVRYAMIFEGVNDIGDADTTVANQTYTVDRLIQAYKQIVTRVHTFGIPLFAATITPFGAPNSTIQPYSDPLREQSRQTVNEWIRNSGVFDAVVDFDAIISDPSNHTQLNPLYNSGDYLHPNVAGYQAIANAFPLDIFARYSKGVNSFM